MKTAIVDYGMGNLHSVLKSVQAAQALSGKAAEIYLTARPEDILAADKIIFPGQGAMPDCMAALRQSGLGEALEDGLKTNRFSASASARNYCSNTAKKATLPGWAGLKAGSNAFLPIRPMQMEVV